MAALASSIVAQAAEASQFALVIGVGAYDRDHDAQRLHGFIQPTRLHNAVRDAELVAEALTEKDFQTTLVIDPDKRAMLAAVNSFAIELRRAGPGGVGIVYFAGHGAQGRPPLERDVENYLIPLGASLATEVDLEAEAVGLSRLSATLRPAENGAVVIILDACRDFPLPQATRSGMVSRGLAEGRAAPNTYIAYATAPGTVAWDGPIGENGFYARALVDQLRKAQGMRLEDIFIAVRNQVLIDSKERQQPWENSSLKRSVVIGVAPPPDSPSSIAHAVVVSDPCDAARRDWGAISSSDEVSVFQAFAESRKDCPALAALAQSRANGLLEETQAREAATALLSEATGIRTRASLERVCERFPSSDACAEAQRRLAGCVSSFVKSNSKIVKLASTPSVIDAMGMGFEGDREAAYQAGQRDAVEVAQGHCTGGGPTRDDLAIAYRGTSQGIRGGYEELSDDGSIWFDGDQPPDIQYRFLRAEPTFRRRSCQRKTSRVDQWYECEVQVIANMCVFEAWVQEFVELCS